MSIDISFGIRFPLSPHVELIITILIVPHGNLGVQSWRVGEMSRQHWRNEPPTLAKRAANVGDPRRGLSGDYKSRERLMGGVGAALSLSAFSIRVFLSDF